jgi:adenylosuccinate lyase
MRTNLEGMGGLVFSSRALLELVDTGMSREDAYVIVQRNAMKTWRGNGTFRENLEADAACPLPESTLDGLFDPGVFLSRKDVVFDRLEELTFRP